jgi:UDP-galactopyranose mutase
MKTNWLIVGAGFTGAVLAERIASQLNQKVLIIDQRDHIGGNAYDYYDEHGVLIHKYGAHIFHANSPRIWEYVSQFTSWRPYFHEVQAQVEGKLVPVPFNLNSLHALFPRTMAERLEQRLIERFGFGTKVPILKMLEDDDSELKELAKYVYRNVFESYTLKQWGLKPEELDSSVTGRVPIYVSRDNRYFQDTFQGIPRQGYTEMFRRMLSHPNIQILLKANHADVAQHVKFDRMIFTGAIDEYFNYIHGPLPYRSLRFDLRHELVNQFQAVSVVNYPNEYQFTRVLEYKQFSGQNLPGTTLAYEYPEAYEPGVNTPYYPIPREQNREKYSLYQREAEKLNGSVIFAGRLADYKYYNMDQAVGRALKVFAEQINNPGQTPVETSDLGTLASRLASSVPQLVDKV